MVQLTFEKVLKYYRSYQFGGSVKSWIFSIARNVLVENWRKKETLESLDLIQETKSDEHLSADSLLMIHERKELINRAIQKLNKEQRELLSMIKLQEMSYKEVAEIYKLPVGTLKVRVFRIITQLKKYMQDLNAREHY